MIKKSILVFLVLLLGYHWITKKYLLTFDLFLNQNQQNVIKGQEYVFGNVKRPSVIVGSSMSNKLEDFMIPGIDNLSLNGSGVATGLAFLRISGEIPDTIYVEATDVLFRPVDKNMVESLENPFLAPLRRYLPEFRDKNQPLTFVVWRLLKPLNLIFASNKENKVPAAPIGPLTDQARSKVEKKVIGSTPLLIGDTAQWNYTLEWIGNTLETFKKRGSVIVLFEMPEDLSNYESFSYNYVRDWAKRNLPYPYVQLNIEEVKKYKTGDGVHLDSESCIRYSQFFNAKVRRPR